MVRAAVDVQTILQPRYSWSGVSCDITAQWYSRVDHSIHVLHELISLAINQRRNCVKCTISQVDADHSFSLLIKMTNKFEWFEWFVDICLFDLLPYPTPPGHSAFCPLQLHSQPGRYISQHPQAEPVGSAVCSLLKRNTHKNKNVLYTVCIYI